MARRISERKHARQDKRRPTPPGSPKPERTTDPLGAHPKGAVDAAKIDLFTTTTRTADDTKPKTAALNIATAQRLVLADLQHDIAFLAEVILSMDGLAEPNDIKNLGRSVKEYCGFQASYDHLDGRRLTLGSIGEAQRNFEYMQECAARYPEDDERDPFYLKSTKVLQREDANLIPYHMQPKGRLPGTLDRACSRELPGTARGMANEEARAEQLTVRFLMAVTGGLALLIPMLVMTYFPGKNVSVVTTSVAMLIFAIVITLATQLAPDQVLGATAAYAAVLVVFVGTSLTM
ncbi:hypothetical protein MBLNU13_g06662t1 [Cladosporium sp. NU13]